MTPTPPQSSFPPIPEFYGAQPGPAASPEILQTLNDPRNAWRQRPVQAPAPSPMPTWLLMIQDFLDRQRGAMTKVRP